MIIMNKSACSAVICQPGGHKQNHNIKVVVYDWPLNIYTYNGCQGYFPEDIWNFKVLHHNIYEYFTLKVAFQDQKFL